MPLLLHFPGWSEVEVYKEFTFLMWGGIPAPPVLSFSFSFLNHGINPFLFKIATMISVSC